MKRAFLRKVKPVSCSSNVDNASVGDFEQTPSGVKRRARTSAAMVGLALSMGATGLLVPRQNDGAAAAEPKVPETTPSSVFRVATLPADAGRELMSAPVSGETFDYVVKEGQTLRQVAEQHRVSVQALATANKLSLTAVLKPGQILKVPTDQLESSKVGIAQSPQLLALADLERLPAPVSVNDSSRSQVQSERNQALSRLEQQREKLKSRLAELRREGSENQIVAAAADKVVAPASQDQALVQTNSASVVDETSIPSVAVLPSPTASSNSELDWMRVNQSLVLSENTASVGQPIQQPQVPIANSLKSSAPTELATRSTTLDVPATLGTAPLIDSSAGMAAYQVSPGDTVARIARTYNVSQADLISANRLSNPNVIFVGQVLRVPAGQQTIQQSVSEPSVPSVIPTLVAQSTNDTSMPVVPTVPAQASTRQVAVVPSSILPPASVDSSSGVEIAPAAGIGGRNPYVQNLLSEVKALREKRQQNATLPQQSATLPQASNVVAAAGNSVGSAASLRSDTVVVPQAVTPSRVQGLETSPQVATPTVVAAAPLGSENYAPLLEPVTGRMVSPDLPSLPDADRFLPNGTMKGYIWPARGVLSSGYGWRWGRMHRGIDIASDIGTPIHAAANGVVEYAGWNSGGYGNMVEIRHADGSMTRYAHMNAIYVQQGQRVRQSEQIGEMGSTGYSTGPHLHFEVHLAEGTVNPMAYLPAQ